MSELEHFKRIDISLTPLFGEKGEKNRAEPTIDSSVQTFIDGVNRNFADDELRLYRNGETIELWLRELSMAKLEQVMGELITDKMQKYLCDDIQQTIKNIGSYGMRGNKRLYVGYNKERKVANRKGKEARRGKHYYANDHAFIKNDNPLPSAFCDKIIQGDSEDVLKRLPEGCIDLIFTSPPYNFGLSYETSNDTADWDAYFAKLFRVFDECIRVLKYGGRLIINIQPLFSDYIPSHHIISHYMMAKKMIWKGEILWEKNNYNCKYTSWGSWKSPSSPYLKYTWEFVEVFCKGQLKKEGLAENADIDADSFKKWVMGKWSIAPARNMKELNHPAMFPEELAQRVLLLFSFKGDVILDPFAGVGTTCVAAKKHQRSYVGIDISQDYCETAEQRIAELLH